MESYREKQHMHDGENVSTVSPWYAMIDIKELYYVRVAKRDGRVTLKK